MFHFLGILLKKSVISSDVDGFQSIWYTPAYTELSPTWKFEIKYYLCWTEQYLLSLKLFQMHAAFHPEIRANKEVYKYHHLQRTITHLSEAAAQTFIPGREMSFVKDSIPSKSNYNYVRKYSNSKLDNCRNDFVIVANVSGGQTFSTAHWLISGKKWI